MAFLSSFRIGQQTVYPEELHERLKSFALLENVGDAALRNLLAEANWFALPGGTLLERDGENNAALFLVVTGSLGVFVSDEQGQRHMVALIPAGETVGEMSLIAGSSTHSAQLVALRDTELLRISPDGFEALIARHPRVMMNLMQMLVKRLKDANRGRSPKSQPKTFAIVPLHEGLGEVPIAQRLTNALAGMGRRAAVLDASASDQTAEWFNGFEQAHDVVFYRGDAPDSPWTHLLPAPGRPHFSACPRQPALAAGASWTFPLSKALRPPELLLLHPDGASAVLPDHFSVRSGLFRSHHHLRAGHQADVALGGALHRGRAVGLVLAGGEARGFAIMGSSRRSKEAGVPFDQLGGIHGRHYRHRRLAREWGLEEMRDRMRAVFVDDNPLSDFTLPLIRPGARQRSVRGCAEHFDESASKKCRCPSSRYPRSHHRTHPYSPRRQSCGGALRASVALPGILPP